MSLYQAMITFGILVASVADMYLVDHADGWRYIISLQTIPASALVLGTFFLPESPRWLVQRDRQHDALKVLQSLRGDEEAEVECQEIVADHAATKVQGSPNFTELVTGRVGRLLAVGMTLQLLQQFMGMNAFMYFGPRLYGELHFNANMLQAIINLVNFAATFPALFLADRCGRRSLLMSSALGMAVACGGMGIMATMFMTKSPDGWSVSSETAGIALISMIILFVVNFAYGWGPIVWVYCGEMFPLKYRSWCVAVTTMTNWVGNWVIAQFTPTLLDAFGFWSFFIFGFFALCGLALALWLPETKGVTLEKVSHLFSEKLEPKHDTRRQPGKLGYGSIMSTTHRGTVKQVV